MNPPKLGRFLGFGFAMYGRRAVDAAAGSFVMTRCLSLLWLPVLAIGAYRVSYKDEQLTFLEKDRLSALALLWNVLVVAATMVFGGILIDEQVVNSPNWKAREQVKIAETLLQNGKEEAATREFMVVLQNQWPLKDEARDGMKRSIRQLLNRKDVTSIHAGIDLIDEFEFLDTTEIRSEAIALALPVAEEHASTNPKEALQLIGAIRPISDRNADLSALEHRILKDVAQKDPGQLERLLVFGRSDYRLALLPLIADKHPEMAREWTEQMFGQAKSIDEKTDAAIARADLAVDLEDRIDWLSKTRLTDPNIAIEVHEGRASLARQRGDSETAKTELQSAVARFADLPENADTFHRLGRIQLQLMNREDAKSALERAFELDSDDADIRRDLALALFDDADQFVRAKSLLEPMDDPKSIVLASQLARLLVDEEWARQLLELIGERSGEFVEILANSATDFPEEFTLVDDELGRTIPAYREIRTKTAQTWNARERVIWALWQPQFQDSVLTNPDFQSALGVEREQYIRSPDRPTLETWALFEKADSAFASQVRRQADTAFSELQAVVDFETGRSGLAKFFLLKLRGADNEAERIQIIP